MLIRRLSFALVGLTLGVVTPLSGARADLADGARQVVVEMSQQAMHDLTDKTIDRDTRKVRMRNMMDRYFQVDLIARWVLGRSWRQATDDQRQRYLKLYEELMIETYVDRFASYHGEKLEVGNVDVREGKDAIVSSTFIRPGAEKPVNVDWRLRKVGDQIKVIDVMIEGVSMGQTQRSEFTSAIKNADGDIDKFLDDLRQRVETASATTD